MTSPDRAPGAPQAPVPAPEPAATGPALPRFFGAGVATGLIVAVLAIYLQTESFDFVNYDDPRYVYENPHVTGGVTAANVTWAFRQAYAANWHPLTWLSHMTDWELYRSRAGGHHLTSVLLHGATAVVLFAALVRLTGAPGPSAATAALWAVHPLRVESVAWVSERKDVLSGLFFALTLLAYGWYVSRPSVARLAFVAGALALGLLSKAMLVTVPFVLLLLDYWPLNRLNSPADVRLAVREKLPLFGLIVTSCVVTAVAQQEGGAVSDFSAIPAAERGANAAVAYVVYAVRTARPIDLAAFYPHPHFRGGLPAGQVFGACALLLGTTAAVVRFRRRAPYLAVGWFWYLGMLVPVIGLVQIGAQAHADRYTYLPQIGLFIMVVWGLASAPVPRGAQVAVLAIALALFGGLAWRQTAHWRNGEALFAHAEQCTDGNFIAHLGLAQHLDTGGRRERALEHYQMAYQLAPTIPQLREEYSRALMRQGMEHLERQQFAEAIAELARAVQIDPGAASAHDWLGVGLGRAGRNREALAAFQRAVELDPTHPTARPNLTNACLEEGGRALQQKRTDLALRYFSRAVELSPDSIAARNNLGVALYQAGRPREAVAQFQKVLELDPTDADARQSLKILLGK